MNLRKAMPGLMELLDSGEAGQESPDAMRKERRHGNTSAAFA